MNNDPQHQADAGPCPRCGEDMQGNETPGAGSPARCGRCDYESKIPPPSGRKHRRIR